MKNKIILSLILFFTVGCSGYEPIFSTKNFNFYIDEVITLENDKVSKKIEKKFKPYQSQKNISKNYNLKIISYKEENIIAKDSKGDPTIFEMNITSNVEIISNDNKINKMTFNEKFNFNNQSNKFELNQYKKIIEKNLINNIFNNLIIKIQTL
jgi:hypothetical protein